MRSKKVDRSQLSLGLGFPAVPLEAAKAPVQAGFSGSLGFTATPLSEKELLKLLTELSDEKDADKSLLSKRIAALLVIPQGRVVVLGEGNAAVVLAEKDYVDFTQNPYTDYLLSQEIKLQSAEPPPGLEGYCLIRIVNFGKGIPEACDEEYLRSICEARIARGEIPRGSQVFTFVRLRGPSGHELLPYGLSEEWKHGSPRGLLAKGGVLRKFEGNIPADEKSGGDFTGVLEVIRLHRARSGKIRITFSDGFQEVTTPYLGGIPGLDELTEGQTVFVTGWFNTSNDPNKPFKELRVKSLSPVGKMTLPEDLWPRKKPQAFRASWEIVDVISPASVLRVLKGLASEPEIYLDVETSQDPRNPGMYRVELVQIGVCKAGRVHEGKALLIPGELLRERNDGPEVVKAFKELLGGDEGPRVWIQYSEFETARFGEVGVRIERIEDTRTWARRLQPYLGNYSLQTLAAWNLGVHIDKAQQKSDWSKELSDDQREYAALDVQILALLADHLKRLERVALAPLDWIANVSLAEVESDGRSLAEHLLTINPSEAEDLQKLDLEELFKALNECDETIFALDASRNKALFKTWRALAATEETIAQKLQDGAFPYNGPFGQARFAGTHRIVDLDRIKNSLLSRTKKPSQRQPIEQFLGSAQAFASGGLSGAVDYLKREIESKDEDDDVSASAHTLLTALPGILEKSRRPVESESKKFFLSSRAQEEAWRGEWEEVNAPDGSVCELMEQYDHLNTQQLREIFVECWPLSVLLTRRTLLESEIQTRVAAGATYNGTHGSFHKRISEVYSFQKFEKALDELGSERKVLAPHITELLLYAAEKPWISEEDARAAVRLLYGNIEEEYVREILRPCVRHSNLPREPRAVLRATGMRWGEA